MTYSRHYAQDRKDRENRIQKIGEGTIIKTVVVDRGHHNGPEIHEISDTGIITVFNKRTHKLITKMIARPGQIKRYFTKAPKKLLDIAYYNSYVLGYNY